MKKVVILQSNYIPWKGYFDLIHDADVFVFYDDVQYTNRDWRNRNKIMTSAGPRWLSIPCGADTKRLICEVQLNDHSWQAIHWDTIRQNYRRAPYFELYHQFFEEIYLRQEWENLSELNQHIIKSISKDLLGIETRFEDSRSYQLSGKRLARILDLVTQSEATHYISGPAAKSYIDEAACANIGVELIWKDYSGYPEYSQSLLPFEHGVSVLDLLFHTGPAARDFIWGHRQAKK